MSQQLFTFFSTANESAFQLIQDQSKHSRFHRKIRKTMSDLTKSLYALKEPLKAKVTEISEKSQLYQHVSRQKFAKKFTKNYVKFYSMEH